VVGVTVTDSETCQSKTDQISVEVIQSGQLVVDIFSDGNATLGHPEVLQAHTGTFEIDEQEPQNVLFTPTSRPSVTVQVTVTDEARNACASDDDCAGTEVCTADSQCAAIATEELEIATFAASIVGDTTISSNSVAEYSIVLSGDAPSNVLQSWSIIKRDADDSLTVAVVDDTAAVLQILPQGDGIIDLLLVVIDAADPNNIAEDLITVTTSCSDPSTSGQSGRLFRWIQISGDPVANLQDEDSRFAKFDMPQETPLGFDPIVFECIVENPATTCESSEQVSCATDGQCTAVGGTTCGQIDDGLCDGLILSDTTVIYAEPVVEPRPSTAAQTKMVGSSVAISCQQLLGSTADAYDWREIPVLCSESCASSGDGVCDDGGADSDSSDCVLGTDCEDCGIRGALCADTCDSADDGQCDDGGPGSDTNDCNLGTDCIDCGPRAADGSQLTTPTVDEFSVDSSSGVLTFVAPSTAQSLLFECRGIISGPDGDLGGPYNTVDQATIDVVDYDVSVVVQDGDAAAGGALAGIDVDRIRLTNASPGEVVFGGTLIGGSADSGVFANSFSGTNDTLVLEGDAAPNGGTFGQIGPPPAERRTACLLCWEACSSKSQLTVRPMRIHSEIACAASVMWPWAAAPM
jgi:hypothetical protein